MIITSSSKIAHSLFTERAHFKKFEEVWNKAKGMIKSLENKTCEECSQ